jgi:hypothetical protein
MMTRLEMMVLVGMIPLGEAAVETLVAVEETFLPEVETPEAVETRVIPAPRPMVIPTPPFPIRANFWGDVSLTGLVRRRTSMIGGIKSLRSIFGNNARVRSHPIGRRNLRN